ncbi:MAG: PilZ domain-containing protein [Acidobacteria bacterium]|nr:PilZ domain-containing protein [Acidobacteriota bacterium]
MRKFIAECTQQAARLSESAKDLNHIERARLLDILFYASDIGSQMRRSPRIALAIPVRVHCETPGRQWQEDALTRSVSRFGAMLECQQTIQPDDVLVVEHLDSGRSVNARLVWGWRARSGTFVVGLEFLNCSNFWELDWNEPPTTSDPSQPVAALPDLPKESPQ